MAIEQLPRRSHPHHHPTTGLTLGVRVAANPGFAGSGAAAACRPSGLTPREVEVLGLLAAGLSNREIAAALLVSVRTVGRHIENLYGKIGVRGRAGARQYPRAHGLLSPAAGTLSPPPWVAAR